MSDTSNIAQLTGIDPIAIPPASDPALPYNVDRMLEALVREWSKTREICLERASIHRAVATDLQQRADKLQAAIDALPDEIKGAVIFEQKARAAAKLSADVQFVPGGIDGLQT